MSAPLLVPRVDPAPLTELRQRYEEAPNGDSRTRYQMLLLAQQGYKVPQIARIVLRAVAARWAGSGGCASGGLRQLSPQGWINARGDDGKDGV